MVLKIKSKLNLLLFIIFSFCCFNNSLCLEQISNISVSSIDTLRIKEKEYNQKPKFSANGVEFSSYNLSVIFDPDTSSVTGNLTVNYYNNDPVDFKQIPFHLFLSGMQYESRAGDIDILGVRTVSELKTPLYYEVNDYAQLLLVNLSSTLNPYQRTVFEIEFHSIIPDGGLDRANSHGFEGNRIYKFTSFYPMPCVYDEFDEWNIDPYLDSCDPFYHDMAYYYLIIEAPVGIKIAATGELVEKIPKGATTVYKFDPEFPVREVTFASSEDYLIESAIIDGVNISTYYIPKSSDLWENDALDYAIAGFTLFEETYGDYPYSTLNIVEEYASYGGMEYPAQVYASERIDQLEDQYGNPLPYSYKTTYLEKVIVHEIAHQWWYNLVGVDEIDWGFLDEGLVCWSTDYYARINYNNWYYFQSYSYFDSVRTYYAQNHLPSRINQSAYDLIQNNLDWVFISYYKSPLIFEKISRTLGQDNFIFGLKTFFEQYKFDIALLSDLQYTFEETFSENLDWLFHPWFDNDYLPKYRFIKSLFDATDWTLTVIIEDKNEPINTYVYHQQATLRVYDTDDVLLYDDSIWINGTTTISIPMAAIPEKVRLEYGNDVIVQLSEPFLSYIESNVDEKMDLIPGFHTNILIISFMLPLIYLIYSNRMKKRIKCKK